jgi:hypothetical protein
MVQPVMLDRIFQRLRDQFLAGDLVKGLRPPFSRDYLIGHRSEVGRSFLVVG